MFDSNEDDNKTETFEYIPVQNVEHSPVAFRTWFHRCRSFSARSEKIYIKMGSVFTRTNERFSKIHILQRRTFG